MIMVSNVLSGMGWALAQLLFWWCSAGLLSKCFLHHWYSDPRVLCRSYRLCLLWDALSGYSTESFILIFDAEQVYLKLQDFKLKNKEVTANPKPYSF